MSIPTEQDTMKPLDIFDPEMADLLHREEKRQFGTLSLIASENVASPLASCLGGSIFTNKNTEGYLGKRPVSGCQLFDQAEILAIECMKKTFDAEYANIQPGNATIANVAVLADLLNPGDTFLGLTLDNGGHLSHGTKFHYSGRNFNALCYGVDKETGTIDMDQVRQMVLENKPKLTVTGVSSYPRTIDYKTPRKICDEVDVYFWAGCAHDCGLIVGDAIPSSVPYAGVITMSTQKTLRGPRRRGVILCREELTAKLDHGVLPGLQGGPKGDMLTAYGALLLELLQPGFRTYTHQACANAEALVQGCQKEDIRIIADGTGIHMAMLDVIPVIANGQKAEGLLSSVGIVINKNVIPYNTLPPSSGSDLRIGSPAMTARGAKGEEMRHTSHLFGRTLNNKNNPAVLAEIKEEIYRIATSHPMLSNEWISPSIHEESETMYYNR